jgi:hypothetical protein
MKSKTSGGKAAAFVLSGAIAAGMWSAPVHAALPFTAFALGTVQATLDYCGEIDKSNDEYYKQFSEVFTKGVPEGEVREVRNTDAYRDAYQNTRKRLSDTDIAETMSACHQVVPPTQST